MAPGFGSLRDHEIAACFDGRGRVAHLAAHVDHEDVVGVALVDHVAWYAEPGHEYGGAAGDDLVDLGGHVGRHGREQVDAERLGRRLANRGDLVDHAIHRHRRGTETSKSAGFGNSGNHFVVGDAAHAGQHHRVLYVENFGQACTHGGAS